MKFIHCHSDAIVKVQLYKLLFRYYLVENGVRMTPKHQFIKKQKAKSFTSLLAYRACA